MPSRISPQFFASMMMPFVAPSNPGDTGDIGSILGARSRREDRKFNREQEGRLRDESARLERQAAGNNQAQRDVQRMQGENQLAEARRKFAMELAKAEQTGDQRIIRSVLEAGRAQGLTPDSDMAPSFGEQPQPQSPFQSQSTPEQDPDASLREEIQKRKDLAQRSGAPTADLEQTESKLRPPSRLDGMPVTPKRSGNFALRNPDGSPFYSGGGPELAVPAKQRVDEELSALGNDKSARMAQGVGTERSDTASIEDSKKAGIDMFRFLKEQEGKSSRAGVTGKGAPLSKGELKNSDDAYRVYKDAITNSTADFNISKSVQAQGMLSMAQQSLASGDALGAANALGALMQMRSGTAVTDKEFGRYAGSTGVWDRIMQFKGQLQGTGIVDTELSKQLAPLLQDMIGSMKSQQKMAADGAYNYVNGASVETLTPEQREDAAIAARNYVLGTKTQRKDKPTESKFEASDSGRGYEVTE